jgi:hypothetical protein
MSTSKTKVTDNFHSQFQDLNVIPPDLENQLFLNALGDFEGDLYTLTYDDVNEVISEDLSRTELNLLGKLMYKHYLNRERDRIIKLNNIIGRDVTLNGTGNTKQQMNITYDSVENDIENLVSKLKDNSYYD